MNEAVEQTALLTDLPNEILARILENLSFNDLLIFECLNKQFRNVMLKFVWPKKDILNQKSINHFAEQPLKSINKLRRKKSDKKLPEFTIKFIKTVFSRNSIRHIDFSNLCVGKDNDRFSQLFSMTPQLSTLNFSFIKLDKSDLLNIAKFCPLLEELSLDGSLKDAECDEGLNEIFINCLNIKYLNIAGNEEFKGCNCFANIPIQLRYLNIDGFAITSEAMNHLVSRSKNLETLVYDFYYSFPNLNGSFNNFPKLKFLDITCMDAKFLDFSNLKELEMISLELIASANEKTLETLKECPKLRAININCIVILDFNTFLVLKNFKGLKYLHFSGSINNGFINLVQSCQLKYLSLSCCGIRNELIKQLLTQCKSLTHLELTDIYSNNYKSIKQALKKECPERGNVLKLVIKKSKFPLPTCKWCEVIEIEKSGPRLFSHFTDVRNQYHIQK